MGYNTKITSTPLQVDCWFSCPTPHTKNQGGQENSKSISFCFSTHYWSNTSTSSKGFQVEYGTVCDLGCLLCLGLFSNQRHYVGVWNIIGIF